MTLLPHPHDAFFKAFLKDPENLKQFLKDFLPGELLKFLSLNHLQILPEEKIPLSKEKRLIPDLVVETSLLNRTLHIYLLIEHKSQPEIRTFLQIGFYILSLHEEDLKAGRIRGFSGCRRVWGEQLLRR
uniref:Transposase (putative) YhgA-like domain-containing protein n=1 Tax=Caldimicrobium thiodismutans TaxID=1653476 RepID=A0A832GNK3_9BACT